MTFYVVFPTPALYDTLQFAALQHLYLQYLYLQYPILHIAYEVYHFSIQNKVRKEHYLVRT